MRAVTELQVHIPLPTARLHYPDELLDAFESHLDHDSEFLDGAEIEETEVCVYLYGSDPTRLLQSTRRILSEMAVGEGVFAVETMPEHVGGGAASRRIELHVNDPVDAARVGSSSIDSLQECHDG